MQNVMHIATNSGHTAQNDGQTMMATARVMLAASHLMLTKDQRGAWGPPRAQGAPLPLYLKNFSV